MKNLICSLVLFGMTMACAPAFSAGTFSCGDGYVLVDHSRVDGITTMACEKLWCVDLETGNRMGTGNTAAAGYRATNEPVLLEDNKNNRISCFGDRKWCSGDVAGEWNAEYGAYTRGGADTATYKSYQKGSCFSWRLEKPTCDPGLTAVLDNGEWVCATEQKVGVGTRASAIRRTSTMRMR